MTDFRTLLDAAKLELRALDKDEHPFTYCMEHIVPAMAEQGKEPDDPNAFCGWWKAEHASAHEEARHLHVLAGGMPRTEKLNGRDHLVIPVIALMEGVIHAVNADTPEFVPSSLLQRAAHTWNGRPLVLGHPTLNGRQISANDPGVIQRQGFGQIFQSKVSGTRLGMEAWIDPKRLEDLGERELLALVQAGKPIEVSVGAYVKTSNKAGSHNGKSYKAEWLEAVGDHLAFLPKGRGACSLEMGCGAHRAAEATPLLYTLEGVEPTVLGGPGSGNFGHEGRPGEIGGSAPSGEGGGGSPKGPWYGPMSSVGDPSGKKTQTGVEGRLSKETLGKEEIDRMMTIDEREEYFTTGKLPERLQEKQEFFARPKDVKPAVESERVRVDPSYPKVSYVGVDITTRRRNIMDALLKKWNERTTSDIGIDIETRRQNMSATLKKWGERDLEGVIRTAIGARNNASDKERIQSMHDASVELGAECDRKNYKLMEEHGELRAACSCAGGSAMDKTKKAELIAALVTDQHSGFKEGDEELLGAATDEQLETFRAATATRKTDAEAKEKLENEQRQTAAKLKVAEEKLKAASEKPTEEQWLENAPASIKALIERQKTQEAEEREQLVGHLKTAQAEYTEEELKALETAMLQRLARVAKVEPVNFSGRKVPIVPNKQEDYSPPNSYETGIKALQQARK